MFSIAQVVLLLSTSDYEFGLTIVLAVAAILSYWVINAIVSVWVCDQCHILVLRCRECLCSLVLCRCFLNVSLCIVGVCVCVCVCVCGVGVTF